MYAHLKFQGFRNKNIEKYKWPPFLTEVTSQLPHKYLTDVRSQVSGLCEFTVILAQVIS